MLIFGTPCYAYFNTIFLFDFEVNSIHKNDELIIMNAIIFLLNHIHYSQKYGKGYVPG